MLKLSNIQRCSCGSREPFSHELGVATQACKLVEFNPTLFLKDLREVRITSSTGITERRAILNKLSDQQLIDVHNTLVDQCMAKGVNNEQHLFDAIDRTIGERKKLSTARSYQGVVIPRTQAYLHNPLSGNSESQNPKQKLYHLSLG